RAGVGAHPGAGLGDAAVPLDTDVQRLADLEQVRRPHADQGVGRVDHLEHVMPCAVVEDEHPWCRHLSDRGPARPHRHPPPISTLWNTASRLLTPAAIAIPSRQRMLKPVEKQRVAEEIAEQLRSLILNGQYPPGSKLPPERELSKRLGVNRASFSETFKNAQHLGLVRIRQGDGTRVQNFMETGGIELVQHLLPLAGGKPELIRDLLEFRRIFGRELARLAAVRASKDK